MLNRAPFVKLARAPGRVSGFSLVEMLIALAVGLVVVSGVIGIYVSTLKSNSDNLNMLRLNQELRAAMDMMVRDIRRAGFRGDGTTAPMPINPGTFNPFASKGTTNNLAVRSVGPGLANDCITFTYDATALDPTPTGVGGVDDNDKFAYWRDIDVTTGTGVIRARNGGSESADSCSPAAKQPITNPRHVNITALTFTIVSYSVIVNGVSGIDRIIRYVTISVTGELVSDLSVVRTLTESVRVQSDTYGFS